jgi:hypothetical protein
VGGPNVYPPVGTAAKDLEPSPARLTCLGRLVASRPPESAVRRNGRWGFLSNHGHDLGEERGRGTGADRLRDARLVAGLGVWEAADGMSVCDGAGLLVAHACPPGAGDGPAGARAGITNATMVLAINDTKAIFTLSRRMRRSVRSSFSSSERSPGSTFSLLRLAMASSLSFLTFSSRTSSSDCTCFRFSAASLRESEKASRRPSRFS